MKQISFVLIIAGLLFTTFAEADFTRIIKNYTGSTCEIDSLHQDHDDGSVRFNFLDCRNDGHPSSTNYCQLPAGSVVTVKYTTNSTGETQGMLEMKCSAFDEKVGFTGNDVLGNFGIEENDYHAKDISDNHGDICIGIATNAGTCSPHD